MRASFTSSFSSASSSSLPIRRSSIIASASSRSRSSISILSTILAISPSDGNSIASSSLFSITNWTNLSLWVYSITSSPSSALRTATSICFLVCALSVEGAPRMKAASWLSTARARILLADIPDTSSASGSRSPADMIVILSNLYSLPL